MFVSGFSVKISFYKTILEWNHNIKEWDISKGMWTGELNGGVEVIEIIDKYFQFIWTFGPDKENIVQKSEPCM